MVKTLIKNGYTGAMMAFSRELLPLVLPFSQAGANARLVDCFGSHETPHEDCRFAR